MPRSLKGYMPRVLDDHRSRHAKQLREVYMELIAKYPLRDGVSRRVAVITAKAWLDYEEISREVQQLTGRRRHHQNVAVIQTRLRRRQSSYMGQFMGGLRTLANLSNGNQLDLAKNFQEEIESFTP